MDQLTALGSTSSRSMIKVAIQLKVKRIKLNWAVGLRCRHQRPHTNRSGRMTLNMGRFLHFYSEFWDFKSIIVFSTYYSTLPVNLINFHQFVEFISNFNEKCLILDQHRHGVVYKIDYFVRFNECYRNSKLIFGFSTFDSTLTTNLINFHQFVEFLSNFKVARPTSLRTQFITWLS